MQTSFEALQLKNELIKGLKAQNIVKPTAVQALTYSAFLEGKDLIVESHTGSGKTLAFLLPLFTKINLAEKSNQALILAPTHELAHQIHEQIKLLAKNSEMPITSTILMGEMNIEKQIDKLKNKPHILVVDDDLNICELLKLYLENDGYTVFTANDGQSAVAMFQNKTPDLVLLDIMLPKMDGWQVCREIRKTSDKPIIMLTAKGETFEKTVSGITFVAAEARAINLMQIFEFAPAAMEVAANGGRIELPFTTTVEEVTVTENADWLESSVAVKGFQTGNVRLVAAANEGDETRTAEVTVSWGEGKSVSFTLTQPAIYRGFLNDADGNPISYDMYPENQAVMFEVSDVYGNVGQTSHYKKENPDWNLLEIESADGDGVIIKL